MQEITNRIYMETQYPGVTLGAIGRKQGLVLIDAPFDLMMQDPGDLLY